MVLGPPGTGKTDVLAAIALVHAILFGYRLLIVSHTNIAIDTAVLRLVKFLRKLGLERFLDQQRLVRYGNPHLAELETDEYRSVTMPLIVADLVAQNREEVTRLESRREILLAQLATDREALPKLAQAWEQQKARLQRQQRRAERTLIDLQAEEQARLVPIIEQLTPRLDQRVQEEETMKNAGADWEKATRQLSQLELSYQDQWTSYDAEHKKLKRLRKHRWLVRFVIQMWTDEWEKDLKETVQALVTPLQQLARQMDALRLDQRRDCAAALDWRSSHRQGRTGHRRCGEGSGSARREPGPPRSATRGYETRGGS